MYFGDLRVSDYLRMKPDGELMTKSVNRSKGVCHGPTTTGRPGPDTPVWRAELDGYTNAATRDIARQEAKCRSWPHDPS